MSDELISEIIENLKKEKIRFGSCEIKFTFHDGQVAFYEISTNQRRNVNRTTTKNKTIDYGRAK